MMIYSSNNQLGHQAPTMSSASKTSPRARHKASPAAAAAAPTSNRPRPGARPGCGAKQTRARAADEQPGGRCRGRCRVQWSEQHVKEGLVLVQEAQLARVVKTRPISEHYDIESKPFASGQWARVYKCRSRSTGTVYAAKFSSRSRFNADCSAELRHEIALLSLCSQSPRVVRLHDVYETPKEIIMVMEYAPGGDLQTLIDGDLVPLEGDVVHFVRQLVEGLAYLHERNIAHLDIKPQNLVMMGSFPDCDVKLCDFEISRVVLEGADVREILGTPDYVAPEILHYEPITLAADMWSLGVTTYVLLTGFSPFGGETDQETFKNIILGQVDFPEELFEDVSAQAKDFVAKLLVLEPSGRMTAKQCLRHEWLVGAPTQASAHLRKYLSKSREVLLERVVSRENLRRAALLSQTAANVHCREQAWAGLSQSEMCLSSRGLADSDDSLSSSRSSLANSQSCLLNKEQTQGLLNQAQDRGSLRDSLAHGLNRVTLLSKIRKLSQGQSRSQACLPLLHGCTDEQRREQMHQEAMGSGNPLSHCRFDGSREKLYGLKSLSKSQGMLDIYRSLESLQRHRRDLLRQKERSKTEDALPLFRQLTASTSTNSFGSSIDFQPDISSADELLQQENLDSEPAASETRRGGAAEEASPTGNQAPEDAGPTRQDEPMDFQVEHDKDESCGNGESVVAAAVQVVDDGGGGGGEKKRLGAAGSEGNLDSLQSLESDTLTDDSEESRGSGAGGGGSGDGGSCVGGGGASVKGSECEADECEPKYSVAQLVSAFNKHQEVASRTSLEAIMTEKKVVEEANTFPIGPKALRLFIPDIDISERKPLVRRKTSYKPRKDWEELRKQSERNEALASPDSGNEDDSSLAGSPEPPLPPPPPPPPQPLGAKTSRAPRDVQAARIQLFAANPPRLRIETKTRLAAKEKLCTGSYERAMERFSSRTRLND